MIRRWSKAVVGALLLCGLPVIGFAQGRTAGQIVGTVKDASGGVVPGAVIVLINSATSATVETKSGTDGNFTFPNLQPGKYEVTATLSGFQPTTIREVVVETARSVDIVVQFKVAGVSEQIDVVGRSQVVETTSTTVASTVSNAEIARLPLAGRNILNFALLVPGAATSAGGRDSEYNGLPGGAINITLDGVNNNSARFRSGGTSMFVFAPVRLGAIEEVTVSTAGLTADAGAEGAVQVQFVTRRGTNTYHGSIFDQYSSDRLQANSFVNRALGRPETKLRRHEWGANIGGPIIHGKLFFFANYEQIYSPSEATLDRNIITDEAQQGIFRYSATDNTVRTVNLLDIAKQNNLPSTIDPYVARQIAASNAALPLGTVNTTTSLLQNTYRFINENLPNDNIYPTGRVDYQVSPQLAVRGVLNLHWRDLPRNPQLAGLPQVNGGFTSTYYILSTGADWSIRPDLFYQMSFGGQSNFEEFNPGNTLAIYEPQGGYRINLPLMTSPEPTGDVMPIPRNNPVWNFTNTMTWIKGRHSWTFGGTFRRTTMYESIGGAPPTISLGVGTGDPASSIFTATTIPGVRTADLPTALSLYALLTGRISTAGGTYFLDEDTKQYRLGPAFRREAQNVGGAYVQDQWRVNPRLTLNYGLRWEFSGAATNPNEVYSGPEVPDLFGPSTAPFQPGVLNGVQNPQILLRPKPYKGDFNNPAPNVGVVWSPDKAAGAFGSILGKATYRANYGVNYYDEGLINFQSANGNGPGLSQTLALPPFTPGSLNLQTPLPAFTATPASFTFPIPMSGFTFNRGFRTTDPDIRTPYVHNWTFGYQRELPGNAAFEIRYVGNHGYNLWRSYNLNETNIIENQFLQDFVNAQNNLAINRANGRTGFANQGLPGQVALPIFETAFGARGSQPAVPANSGFTNGTFITQLDQGQAGRLANTMAGDFRYLCAMVGSNLPGCVSRGYDALGPYPINVFQSNPFAAGSEARLLTDEAESKYDAIQIQFRKRYVRGVSVTAHYTYGKARTDRYIVGADGIQDYRTLRDKSLDWGPTAYDLRHNFQTYWTYDLPFGEGRKYDFDSTVLDQIVGGWTASGIVRIQSGRPFLLTSGRQTLNQQDAGVVLNGITVKELQSMLNVRPGPNGGVYFVDERLIGSDGRANPELLAPPTTPGQQGQYVYLTGPGFWNVDMGFAKMFTVKGSQRINVEFLAINAFDHRNNVVGGTGGATHSIDSTSFGQTTGTAIGAREFQIRLGFTF
jgi:hypothetical protein